MPIFRPTNLDPQQVVRQRAATSLTVNELDDGTTEVIHAREIEIEYDDEIRQVWDRFEAPYATIPRRAGEPSTGRAALAAIPDTVAVPTVETPIIRVHPQAPPGHTTNVVNHGRDGRRIEEPYISRCGCLEVLATPVTLPWLVPTAPGLNPDAVMAVGMIHQSHTLERMQQMVPYLEGRCQMYDTTPAEVATTLMALHNIHWGGNKSDTISENQRNKALSVAMEMYGSTAAVPAQTAIDAARKQPWVRTIEFAGETTLTALVTTGITGSAAAATYMAGAWVGAKVGTLKAATTVGAKVQAGSMVVVGGAATAALGAVTVVAGGASAVWWYGTITAFRDVWDNSFAKDAYFFHKMRHHHVLPSNDHWTHCEHGDGEWTSPNTMLNNWRKGRRWN